MKVQFYPELFIPIAFLILLIIIPGISLWVSLRLIGKRRGIIRCGVANLSAFLISVIFAGAISFIPFLTFLTPIIFLIIYFYILKEILDVNLIEAFAATAISLLVMLILMILMASITGIWISLFEINKVVKMIKF